MKFVIAERTGKTLHELDTQMSAAEFMEWYVLITSVEPWEREQQKGG